MARPFRYTLILASVALGTALAAVGGWRYARASAPLSGPIIVISIDALRADHLPAYGYSKITTPAIDALAAEGVVFERAYSHAPLTLPSHAALLSGRLPFETAVRDDAGSIKPTERLLPELLRDRGYRTAAVVSSSLLRKETGLGRGFDFFDDALPDTPDAPIGVLRRDGADAEVVAERWLETAGTSRAFLFLHVDPPHQPYDEGIASADAIVGRLVRYLKTHQLFDRSTIILLSDHGEGLGDHGEQEHGLFVYDEDLRVPLVIKQESNAGAGRRVPDLVQHLDVVPTILDLVKAPVPGNLRGRTLKPLLDGGHFPPRQVYSESLYGRNNFGSAELTAVTDGRYRLVNAPRGELYDLERDPHERVNLFDADGPAAQAQLSLARRLKQLVPPSKTPEAAEDAVDPKDIAKTVETYRAALDLAAHLKWGQAIATLQTIVHRDDRLGEAWKRLAEYAVRINRYDLALDAYNHLKPAADAYLGAASALVRLRRFEEAHENLSQARAATPRPDPRVRAAADALLARIALARRDVDGARELAERVRTSDPASPLPDYIEARLLYDQGRYADAVPSFEQALGALKKSSGAPIAELHFCAGDAFARTDRDKEAEAELVEELRHFPENTRARAALATLYHTAGQFDAAERVVADMTRVTPTAESYALAVRLLKSFGKPRQAERVRAEMKKGAARVVPLKP